MDYSSTLANLFPNGPWAAGAPTLGTLLASIGKQMDSQSAASTAMVSNFSPYTAGINGIVQWEQAFKLPSDPSLTLQQRRQKCIARAYRLVAPYTLQNLQGLFNAVSENTVQLQVLPHQNLIIATYGVDDTPDYGGMLRFLYSVLPAHIELIPTFFAAVSNPISTRAAPHIIVTRALYANNGGLNKVGNVLNGNWALDGTQTLNGSWQAGPVPSSVVNLTMTARVPTAQYLQTQGFVLNGGRSLDGTWDLSGATTQLVSIGVQKALTVAKTITNKVSSSSKVAVAVTCYASENNTPSLSGTWPLDGAKTLNGQTAASASVYINGLQVA